MDEPTATPRPVRRRWFRFSLRTLLIVIVLVGLMMDWIVKERAESRHEHKVAQKLMTNGPTPKAFYNAAQGRRASRRTLGNLAPNDLVSFGAKDGRLIRNAPPASPAPNDLASFGA